MHAQGFGLFVPAQLTLDGTGGLVSVTKATFRIFLIKCFEIHRVPG